MKAKEIVIISGKGGTGKTTLVASLIPYFKNLVIADCDVDAPDLDILFKKEIISEEDFVGLKKPVLNKYKCINCKQCHYKCKFGAITKDINIINEKCEGCGVCELVCPAGAIKMEDAVVGKSFVSETDYGKMVHAKLIPGEDASGKLVTKVRKTAKEISENEGKDTIIIDGSPGIACNVISSITGTDTAIIVVEPTFSGLHDLERVFKVTQKFRVKAKVVVNKWDLSKKMTDKIEEYCNTNSIELALKIPFDKKMVKAIVDKNIPSIVEKDFFDKIGFDKFVKSL